MEVSCVGWVYLNTGIFTCISATLSSGRVGFSGATGLNGFHGRPWRSETPNAHWVYLGRAKHQHSRTFVICCTLESWLVKHGEDPRLKAGIRGLERRHVLAVLSRWSGPARGVCSAATGQGFLLPGICSFVQTSAGSNGLWLESNARFSEFYKSSRTPSNLLTSQAREPSWHGRSLENIYMSVFPVEEYFSV